MPYGRASIHLDFKLRKNVKQEKLEAAGVFEMQKIDLPLVYIKLLKDIVDAWKFPNRE